LFGSPVPFRFYSRLAPLLEQYLFFRQHLGYIIARKNILYAYRNLDQFINFRSLSRPDQIDEPFAANWMFSIPQHSARTKNMRLQLLRNFCRYLVRLGHLKEDPTRRIPYLREKPPPLPHLYTIKELTRLLQEADRWKSRWSHRFPGWVMGTFVHLVYACGLRLSEATNLKLAHIDFSQNTLSLWKTKFHKERLVPFSSSTAQRLKQYLAVRALRYPMQCGPDDYLFCHKHGKYSSCGIQYLFRQLLLGAGFTKPKGHRIHDLRHTFAVHRLYKWYQDGADPLNKLSLLSTFMGHVNIEQTQVYLTITQALLREGDKRFAALFEGTTKKRLLRLPR
jgi:site-specific recombinase XerD